ncbi:MAG: 50S ribosomal protein L24 [Omnitrophica bacterium RBG_13_46_9]|nr:MAG: 50S ribosomal protein L24 [Omnitrophica bacterium RBG_13_46_9]
MAKIRKNDTVIVLSGKDKGKTGKVLTVLPRKNRAIVEGVNFVKKHQRRSRDDQKGGIVQKEATIHISDLAVFCKGCNRPTKVGFNVLTDGTKTRFCKRCNEIF